jgi:hypothetical protein
VLVVRGACLPVRALVNSHLAGKEKQDKLAAEKGKQKHATLLF